MGPCKGLAWQLSHQLWAHSMSSVVAEHGPMQRSRSAALWVYSMPSVVMGHGPMQRSWSAAHPPAMGPFNVIGSGRAWAHAKVSLGSSTGPFNAISGMGHGPIQRHIGSSPTMGPHGFSLMLWCIDAWALPTTTDMFCYMGSYS
jgi:hypothetical protein